MTNGDAGAWEHSLDRIVLVPRNGYVNRLQAWASSAILAAELDVALEISWEPETVAPATASDLFSQARVARTFVDPESVHALLGVAHVDLPRYVTVLPDRRVVVLAGHDRGEQVLMPELIEALADPCQPTTLLVIAGGKFHLPNATDFARQRRLFYTSLDWSQAVLDACETGQGARGAYLGLHVRETDRSRQAPSAKAIRTALAELRERTGVTSLFLAADNDAARTTWLEESMRLGLEPWTLTHAQTDRDAAAGGVAALADWRTLAHAAGLVYSAASSFGEEAAIASGGPSIALTASPGRQRLRGIGALARSAAHYPRRRGWRRGPDAPTA